MIVRQYVLDRPADQAVLVLPHLVKQWEAELTNRFRLVPPLGETVHVLSHDAHLDHHGPAGLVAIYEAHQLTHWVALSGRERKRFDALRGLVTDPHTTAPAVRHPDASLGRTRVPGLLHLLDPIV